ncbi:MAG: hypothetical protein ABIJ50_12420 [Pseudomonadota bacterium]
MQKLFLPVRNYLMIVVATLVLIASAPAANAGEFGDLKTEMEAARASLLTMLMRSDMRGPEQQKLVIDTANAVSAHLAKMTAPTGKEAQFNEMVENWNAFKQTRENELTTAILSGNEAEAKNIAGGVQKERITKCLTIVDELDV